MINTQICDGNNNCLSTSASGVEGKIIATFTGLAIFAFALVIGLLSVSHFTGKSTAELVGFKGNNLLSA